ncbi:hypothetical protein [Chthonomonas calidirosea]|uniref:Bacterial PH domain n=1 Tax=Chthonomonas calidirosea (strain DSM 23976 / ICMP 18418 / T49) TaxID=1303518 RepID=S0ET93_CHTCT|nr:hypothetical protein [Chthonomonas calidirosea]CCW34624.1 hypothetical protein CCALI_00799 [Chthonomonas calidirosea T49]CEK13084.1 hypothetical protein CP488_00352 [Chthonomonas calidirosea]CEK14251.1 hypothetical protein CTKA_00356 [Chthonomonas calidirosea]
MQTQNKSILRNDTEPFHPPYVLRDWRTLSFGCGTVGVVILWAFLGCIFLLFGFVNVISFFEPNMLYARIKTFGILLFLLAFAWPRMVGYRCFHTDGIVVFNGLKKRRLPYAEVSRVAVQTVTRYTTGGGVMPIPDTFLIYGPDGTEFTCIWPIDPNREEIIAFVLSCLPERVRNCLDASSQEAAKPEATQSTPAANAVPLADEGSDFEKESLI